jgi:serine/threonine protein phosphatase 1
MRTIAIGDIHGCRTALETLIGAIDPRESDQFVFLGDYINRGPDSRGVIEFLIDFATRCRCVFLRGNHEVMTLDACAERTKASSWSVVGGGDALRSYGFTGRGDWWEAIPESHWKFLEQTGRYFETNGIFSSTAVWTPNWNYRNSPIGLFSGSGSIRFVRINPGRK